jgi:hypothetical protein
VPTLAAEEEVFLNCISASEAFILEEDLERHN